MPGRKEKGNGWLLCTKFNTYAIYIYKWVWYRIYSPTDGIREFETVPFLNFIGNKHITPEHGKEVIV